MSLVQSAPLSEPGDDKIEFHGVMAMRVDTEHTEHSPRNTLHEILAR